MKSKKSQFFMILVVIIAIGVLTAALLIINLQRPYDKTIGWRQAIIVKTYQEGEKALFYTDQSAKYSAYQTIYELGQKGGYEQLQILDALTQWREEHLHYLKSVVEVLAKATLGHGRLKINVGSGKNA